MESNVKIKKILRMALVLVVVLIIVIGIYLFYVFSSYKRLPDRVYLDTETTGAYSYFEDSEAINTETYYNIATYNIGFGAYTSDFSFFMDGGKSSWAESEDHLLANLCKITDVINKMGVDFIMLQEVDTDSTRTYHVNELELINQFVKGYYYNAAECWDSPFLMYPLRQPHGASKVVQVTYSKAPIAQAVRRSLPINDSLSKVAELDRCYVVTRIPTANEKMLVLYNVHLSAYSSDEQMRKAQFDMLFKDMESEYKAGNYVICGGDFNRNLRKDAPDSDMGWALPFPREDLPKGFLMPIDTALPSNVEVNTCRNANEPYNEETSFTVTTDGFIISDNIRVNYYNHCSSGYAYSDHEPVLMQIFLKP